MSAIFLLHRCGTLRHLADCACNYRWSTRPRLQSTRIGTCRLRVFNCHEQRVPQLELVSVTDQSFDQKYNTSWFMDDIHHQILHVAQASLKSKYSQVTASRQSANGTTAAQLQLLLLNLITLLSLRCAVLLLQPSLEYL